MKRAMRLAGTEQCGSIDMSSFVTVSSFRAVAEDSKVPLRVKHSRAV